MSTASGLVPRSLYSYQPSVFAKRPHQQTPSGWPLSWLLRLLLVVRCLLEVLWMLVAVRGLVLMELWTLLLLVARLLLLMSMIPTLVLTTTTKPLVCRWW
ncbi:hypothetical protein PC116_g10732 [Phytophthora cactorum]|uniref:Uncharacterized protein n=2 Tax=Phytophthora cactorum TaxID=29920 RepID=A0A8T1L1Z7_9STRA|nr:hypothetical protein PC114_g7777 [Phytophthora cactorum]KAG2946356.1 hypothetical protein PC117_g7728 [Phytophthora cactorum]KAG3026228.1 hypothetical protein PC120_g6017 [Phytophthora cactorum]KAG3027459.1 hypothetical protein PC119_g7378 [Phytophthora cactorum]KAG3177777.1 hypothetical protein C6341_g8319 [Phytophthora cactorum]